MCFHSINFIEDIYLFAILESRILFYADFPLFKANNDLIRLIFPQHNQKTRQTDKSIVIPYFSIVPTGDNFEEFSTYLIKISKGEYSTENDIRSVYDILEKQGLPRSQKVIRDNFEVQDDPLPA